MRIADQINKIDPCSFKGDHQSLCFVAIMAEYEFRQRGLNVPLHSSQNQGHQRIRRHMNEEGRRTLGSRLTCFDARCESSLGRLRG